MTAQNSAAGQGAQAPLLEVRDLSTYFPVYGGALSTVKGYVHAVDGVSFTVNPARDARAGGGIGLRQEHPHPQHPAAGKAHQRADSL